MVRNLLAVRISGRDRDIEKVLNRKPRTQYGSSYGPLSTRNRAQSPLLRLPCEVLRIIWRYLLGDNVIHLIDTEKVATWRDGQSRVIPGHVICGVDSGRTASHEECLGHIYCTPVTPDYKHCEECATGFNFQQVDLRALRVCSDIYLGASEALMSTNTFYFDYNFRIDVLKGLWGAKYSTAMKRVRLTLPINWRYSLEVRRLLDMAKMLHSCQDLQINLHQNSWLPDYYRYQFLVGPFGISHFKLLFTELRYLLACSNFDDVEVILYQDSSLGPENLPATCRHQYEPAELLQVKQFERLLQWSYEDATLVNEHVKALMDGEPRPESYIRQDQDREKVRLADDCYSTPLALVRSLGRFKDDFRKQLTAYWKYLRGMPLEKRYR